MAASTQAVRNPNLRGHLWHPGAFAANGAPPHSAAQRTGPAKADTPASATWVPCRHGRCSDSLPPARLALWPVKPEGEGQAGQAWWGRSQEALPTSLCPPDMPHRTPHPSWGSEPPHPHLGQLLSCPHALQF